MRKFSLSMLIVLAVGVLAAGTGGILYLTTTPDQRNTVFWISLGTIALGVGLSAWLALVSTWSDSDGVLPFPSLVSLSGVVGGYTLFALGAAVTAWRFVDFSVTAYLVTHIAGGTVFLLGGVLYLMGAVNAASHDRQSARGRARMADLAREMEQVASELSGDAAGECRRLAEALRFSDPVTPGGLGAEDDAVARVRESAGASPTVADALAAVRRRNDLVARGK